jgi:phosphoribosylformimino-5-aminoimidazole carboxamide ribotide isomerase
MQLWPAIDLLDGKPVRLFKGEFAQKTEYDLTIPQIVNTFNEFASGIHVIDLNGARDGTMINQMAIADIVKHSKVPVELGGGIRNKQAADHAFEMGVSRVILGTSAVENPQFVAEMFSNFGTKKTVIGVDCRKGLVAVKGWKETSNLTDRNLITALEKVANKYSPTADPLTVIYTDITRDGTLTGPPIAVFERLMNDFPTVQFIASGGIGNMEDVRKLQDAGVQGAIFGKAFYDGCLTLDDFKKHDHA